MRDEFGMSFPNRFLGIGRLPMEEDGSLTRFAFPGGYEVFYVTDDGSVLCAQCANGEITRRVEFFASDEIDTSYPITDTSFYDASERITGWSAMDREDSCSVCDECGRIIAASGCGYRDGPNRLYFVKVDGAPMAHGPYRGEDDDVKVADLVAAYREISPDAEVVSSVVAIEEEIPNGPTHDPATHGSYCDMSKTEEDA